MSLHVVADNPAPALQVSSSEVLLSAVLFRLARCEEALRRSMQVLEDVKVGKIPNDDELDAHIAYLASAETPEDWRP